MAKNGLDVQLKYFKWKFRTQKGLFIEHKRMWQWVCGLGVSFAKN